MTKVSSGGFTSPTDAVASPDGRKFYFAAWDDQDNPALFAVSAEPGSAATPIVAGDPLDAPLGLVMSCDGSTVYIADLGGEAGALLAAPAAGGTASVVQAGGLTRPGGLAMAHDCKSLFATGRLDDGTPALFQVPLAGGDARVVYAGQPLVAPTGVHVDDHGVAWVMDHQAQGDDGEGALFAIPSDGSKASVVISNLRMGTPGGVSLTAGGGTAVMPTRDAGGNAQLTSVDIATGQITQLPTPDIADPAGIRSARKAGVFALVDSEAGAIFLAK